MEIARFLTGRAGEISRLPPECADAAVAATATVAAACPGISSLVPWRRNGLVYDTALTSKGLGNGIRKSGQGWRRIRTGGE